MIKTLTLIGFRNHQKKEIQFSKKINLIVGVNAAGKSNILEALWLLSTGESFRASKVDEMVNWEAEVGHVMGEVEREGKMDEIQVTVTRGMVSGKRVPKRLYKINGTGKRKLSLLGYFGAVLFRPEDMDLISGEPSLRRSFLDEVLVQIDADYQRSLLSYQKGLRQRNRLLDQIREGRVTASALLFWDQLLLREGTILYEKRTLFLEQVNQVEWGAAQLRIVYEPSMISPEALKSHFAAEVAVGYTLVGPHKDDFRVMEMGAKDESLKERDLSIYGSRGEQRMAVLWLKEAQIAVMEKTLGSRPTLLLDDILSELDHRHIGYVVRLCDKQQTILTTTDEALSDYFGSKNTTIRLGGE